MPRRPREHEVREFRADIRRKARNGPPLAALPARRWRGPANAASMHAVTRRAAVPVFVSALLLVSLAGWLAAVAALWRSYFGMFPATGVVAALADAVLRGQAPGHEDGTTFLVSYYFPPFPILVAAAHRSGLEWLQSLRASSLLCGALVLASAAWVAHALGAGRRGAWLAPALVAATYSFKASAIDGRADLLAVAFSLGALAAWTRDPKARGWALPALAAASLLTKATSVSVPLALAASALFRRDIGTLARFAWRCAACALLGLLLTLPAHGPEWYMDVLETLVAAPPGESNLLRAPAELVRYLGACGELALFVTLALALLLGRRMRGAPVAAFAAASLLITLGVMTNVGSGPNHLDELGAVAAIGAAAWAAPRLARPALLPPLALAIAVLGASWRDLLPAVRHAGAPGNVRAGVIDAVRSEPGPVLTEDALISLAAGRRPAVSDAAPLNPLSSMSDPRALRVVADLERRRFTLIVLDDDLRASARWYRVVYLGEPFVEALKAHYRAAGVVDGYYLYRPGAE